MATAQPAALRRRARYSFFGARLNQWLGRRAQAERLCRRALSFCDYTKAYRLLSELELPGEHYFKVLARVHEHVRPATYLEVGVSRGDSLQLVGPQTLALGIDPEPRLGFRLSSNQQVFAQTSDDFFARPDVPALLGGKPLDMAFIDGMHHFEYALRDFINIEPLCRAGFAGLHPRLLPDRRAQRRTRPDHGVLERGHLAPAGTVEKVSPRLEYPYPRRAADRAGSDHPAGSRVHACCAGACLS